MEEQTNNILKLTFDEKELINNIIDKSIIKNLSISESGTFFYISISDEYADIISEKIKDMYVYEGFDKDYNQNKKGKVYRSLIDKFYEIGW